MGDEDELFSSPPVSFRIGHKSAEAAKLKASVSAKLLDFLQNYTDDVLPKYIVVLVCNGKNQHQARDDLEAFLGNKSSKFISWLWHHLSEETCFSKLFDQPLPLKDDIKLSADKSQDSMVLHTYPGRNSSTFLPHDDKNQPSTSPFPSNSSTDIKISENTQHCEPNLGGMLSAIGAEGPQTRSGRVQTSLSKFYVSENRKTKLMSSLVRSSLETSAGDDQSLQLEIHDEKTIKMKSSGKSWHQFVSHKEEPTVRNLQTFKAEESPSALHSSINAFARRLPRKSTNTVIDQDNRPRGNVWDRLGMPSEDNEVLDDAEVDHYYTDLNKRKTTHCTRNGLDKRARLISRGSTNRFQPPLVETNTRGIIVTAPNFELNRKIDVVDHGHDSASFSGDEPLNMPQKLLCSGAVSGNEHQPANSRSVISISTPSKASEDHLNNEKSVQTPFITSDTVSKPKHEAANSIAETLNHKPKQTEFIDFKLKMQEVYAEVLKLRAKQAEILSEAKPSTMLASGARNHQVDVESRIIFVTNVHFAATKEALSLHFSQCGPVSKVSLLSDVFTGQPKGSAFVIFDSKDSVDEALSLTGTSFMSRTLTVKRKAEMPEGILEPFQTAGISPKPLTQSRKKKWFKRQHSNSHLQWRRDQLPASGETSAT